MGSNLIKTAIEDEENLKILLKMPFNTYFFWFRSTNQWMNGFTDEEKEQEYDAVYAFTKRLLTEYNHSGKKFFLGHWEGDWYLLPDYDGKKNPSNTAIEGLIEWLNTRQKAVDDAKRDVQHAGVQVYHYTEVNRVRDAMELGKNRLTNKVLPQTNVDFVSYSSYDIQQLSQDEINRTLNYIESNLPPKPSISGKRIFIGEFGFSAEKVKFNQLEHDRRNREFIIKFLKWGCPYVIYWQIYDNEVKNGKPAGFWLVNHLNEKQTLYFTFQKFYQESRSYVVNYFKKHGHTPSSHDFRRRAIQLLSISPDS
jgi:hypothetical protein